MYTGSFLTRPFTRNSFEKQVVSYNVFSALVYSLLYIKCLVLLCTRFPLINHRISFRQMPTKKIFLHRATQNILFRSAILMSLFGVGISTFGVRQLRNNAHVNYKQPYDS